MFQFGNKLHIQIFGQSHSEQMGVVIDGFPSGISVDEEALSRFMERRAPGRNAFSTKRKEPDRVQFCSGVLNGKTTGAPICAYIVNQDSRSTDYDALRFVPRPGHADYPAFVKFGEARDHRGGGEFSGRLTAPMCIAGFLCMEWLKIQGIQVGAHIASVGSVSDDPFDPVGMTAEQLCTPAKKAFPVCDDQKGEQMQEAILSAASDADSVGGSIECCILGVPVGKGDTSFGGIEGQLSLAMFGIPAVKGIEFGSGFAGSATRGSQNNDAYYIENGVIRTRTNNAGGILGGISTGMPILFRVAVKPTPSIGQEQDSVSLTEKTDTKLKIVGRHDPCIVQRAVPVVEAMAAVAITDILFNG